MYGPQISIHTIFEWMNNISIQNSFKLNVISERPTEENKALIISHAREEVLDLGTALNTCSTYLVSRAKPGSYRKRVLELLERGVNYTCVVLQPDAEITKLYGKTRGEDLETKITKSLERLGSFAEEVRGKKGKFRVFGYSELPYFACIGVDRNAQGIFLFSPYMPSAEEMRIERGDIMHFLISEAQSKEIYAQINCCIEYYLNEQRCKQLI